MDEAGCSLLILFGMIVCLFFIPYGNQSNDNPMENKDKKSFILKAVQTYPDDRMTTDEKRIQLNILHEVEGE